MPFPSQSFAEKRLIFEEMSQEKKSTQMDASEIKQDSSDETQDGKEVQAELVKKLNKILEDENLPQESGARSEIQRTVTAIEALQNADAQQIEGLYKDGINRAAAAYLDVLQSKYANLEDSEKAVKVGNDLRTLFSGHNIRFDLEKGISSITAKPQKESSKAAGEASNGPAKVDHTQRVQEVLEALSEHMTPEQIKEALKDTNPYSPRGQLVITFLLEASQDGLPADRAIGLVGLSDAGLRILTSLYKDNASVENLMNSGSAEEIVAKIAEMSSEDTAIFRDKFLSFQDPENIAAFFAAVDKIREGAPGKATGVPEGTGADIAGALDGLFAQLEPIFKAIEKFMEQIQPFLEQWAAMQTKMELRYKQIKGTATSADLDRLAAYELPAAIDGATKDNRKPLKAQHERLSKKVQNTQKTIDSARKGKSEDDYRKVLEDNATATKDTLDRASGQLNQLNNKTSLTDEEKKQKTDLENTIRIANESLPKAEKDRDDFTALIKERDQATEDLKKVNDKMEELGPETAAPPPPAGAATDAGVEKPARAIEPPASETSPEGIAALHKSRQEMIAQIVRLPEYAIFDVSYESDDDGDWEISAKLKNEDPKKSAEALFLQTDLGLYLKESGEKPSSWRIHDGEHNDYQVDYAPKPSTWEEIKKLAVLVQQSEHSPNNTTNGITTNIPSGAGAESPGTSAGNQEVQPRNDVAAESTRAPLNNDEKIALMNRLEAAIKDRIESPPQSQVTGYFADINGKNTIIIYAADLDDTQVKSINDFLKDVPEGEKQPKDSGGKVRIFPSEQTWQQLWNLVPAEKKKA